MDMAKTPIGNSEAWEGGSAAANENPWEAHSKDTTQAQVGGCVECADARIVEASFAKEENAHSATLEHNPGKPYLVIKNCFDFLSSLIVSIVLLIPLLILMLIIVLKDPGNPIYLQERVGKDGKSFRMANHSSMENVDILYENTGYESSLFCAI